jgi:hypothetical protein
MPKIGLEDNMSVRIRIAIAVVASIFAANAAANAQTGGASQTSPATQATVAGGAGESQNTIDALKADLQRMRTLLAQLKTNAGFAANVTTPLYHQFELENAMWQVELDHLQRHVDALERANKAPK